MAETFKAYADGGCVAAVASAMPQATQKVIDEVAEAMEVYLKYAEPGDSPQVSLQKAVDQVSGKLRRNIAARKYQTYLNLSVTKRVKEYITQNYDDRVFKGLKSKLVGINSDIKGSRSSVGVMQNELRDHYMAGLIGDLQRTNALDSLINGNEDLHRAVFTELERIGQEGAIPSTNNIVAKNAADAIHKWQEKARLDANDAGAVIDKLPGYAVKQTHDMFRVNEMGRTAWKDLIRERLDWERIEKQKGSVIKDKEKFLDGVYTSIITGEHITHRDAAPSKTIVGNLGKSVSNQRVLHFKQGEWFDYNLEAGSRSILDAAMMGLEKSAVSTGLMRSWGPSAIHNIEQTISELKRAYPDQVKDYDEFWTKAMIGQLTGEARVPTNMMLARAGSSFRTLQNVTKLGSAVVTAGIVDPFVMASELKYQGASPFKGYQVALESDLKSVKGVEREAVARALGVMFQGMASEFHSRLDADGMMSGNMAKINSLYFKANLLTPHTDRLRIGAAEAMSSMAASYSKLKFADLPSKYRRVLGLFDIDETDWEMLRRFGVESYKDLSLLTPQAIENIPDSAIREVKGSDLSDRQVRIIKEELRAKYHSYLIDRVDTAVLKPDTQTAAYQKLGTTSGTPTGELVSTLMQFKGFPIVFIQKVLGREIYGSGEKTLKGALKRPDILLGLGSIMVQSTLLGYGVIAVKSILQGKEPPEFANADVLREAALKGGGLGFYGDVLFGEMRKEWGRSGATSLLGPGFSTIDDMMDLAGRWRDGDLTAAKTIKTVYRNAVPNLFYVKPVLDYGVLYQVMEGLEPGSIRKMERRFEKQQGREYWLSPSDAAQ